MFLNILIIAKTKLLFLILKESIQEAAPVESSVITKVRVEHLIVFNCLSIFHVCLCIYMFGHLSSVPYFWWSVFLMVCFSMFLPHSAWAADAYLLQVKGTTTSVKDGSDGFGKFPSPIKTTIWGFSPKVRPSVGWSWLCGSSRRERGVLHHHQRPHHTQPDTKPVPGKH